MCQEPLPAEVMAAVLVLAEAWWMLSRPQLFPGAEGVGVAEREVGGQTAASTPVELLGVNTT